MMTDECPDFDTTLKKLLSTPPAPRRKVEPAADGDDLEEPQEQDEDGSEDTE